MATKNIIVPDIGGAADVVVIEVLIKVGDHVTVDSPLITLESDKATMEMPSTEEGIVKEIKVKVGDKVSQGSNVVVLEVQPSALGKTTVAEKTTLKPAADTATKPVENSKPVPTAIQMTLDQAAIHAGPAVRKLAREVGIDLTKLVGTGPKQRILKEDLQAYVKRLEQTAVSGGTGLPAAPVVDFTKFGPVATQPLSRIKKLSGKNLQRNWLLAPHVTQFGEADITELDAFRVSQKSVMEKQGIKLTPLVFIMKVVVSALKAFPQFNASLDASGENIVLKNYFHIGVAVDTSEGLVVPVIREVDKKKILDLAKELGAVSEKARNKQLTPNDMQGGCFSISSLGGIGGTAFTPIINLPEVAILGISKSFYKPVYEKDKFIPRLTLPLSLSYDHRVIDGADAARFIVHLTNTLSDIRSLIL